MLIYLKLQSCHNSQNCGLDIINLLQYVKEIIF